MRPKTEKRRLRGIEVAQAALLLVIGVVIALVLYYVVLGMVRSTPAPDVQLDAYNSYVTPKNAIVVLKFGKPAVVKDMQIVNGTTTLTSTCSPEGGSFPLTVFEGQEVTFRCDLATGKTWDTRMTVRVTFSDGRNVNLRWVIG